MNKRQLKKKEKIKELIRYIGCRLGTEYDDNYKYVSGPDKVIMHPRTFKWFKKQYKQLRTY